MKIISVVGTRPNFIKIAPIYRAFQKYGHIITHKICHTGQHFDKNMSKVFFEELEMPEPDFYLGVHGGTHSVQVAEIMLEFEKVLIQEKPDLILVPGDVNSTLAAALVASKLGVAIGHIEAGLRSFDREMPEEINRIITDVLSDLLFVSEPSGMINLKNENISRKKVHFVGNVMIDSLVRYLVKINFSTILSSIFSFKMLPQEERNLGLGDKLIVPDFILSTFHRPSNVDDLNILKELILMLGSLEYPVIFPVHPRTRNNLELAGLLGYLPSNLILTEPLGYIDFLALIKNATLVITDSGGIQEETTFLGVQCLTVRNNTERPVTVDLGTNQLIGTDFNMVKNAARKVLSGKRKPGKIPELWDGKAADRIVDVIVKTKF